jgi:hypothetical protein
MRPKGSAELLADRRRRALKLLRERLSLNEVARRIKCAASSVMAGGMRGDDAARTPSRCDSLQVVPEDSPLANSSGWSGSCFAGPSPMATVQNCGQRSEWRR